VRIIGRSYKICFFIFITICENMFFSISHILTNIKNNSAKYLRSVTINIVYRVRQRDLTIFIMRYVGNP
jgi:hypothetical protein